MKLSNSRTGASVLPVLLVLPILPLALPASAATNVMACAQTKAALVTIWDGASVNSATSLYAFAGTSLPALDAPATNYTAGLSRTYTYAGFLAKGRAATSGELAGKYVFSVKPDASLALVHAQVREAFGFNPLTANPVAFEQGLGVNTKPFTSEDKKAVAAYLKEVYNITAGTLSETAADSDGDGVPDGWELYVMRNGSPAPWIFADRSSDADADGLSLVQEYDAGNSPTDPNDADTDGDGIGDFYAWKYMLKGGAADEDYDGDGLSNYAEYLISEVFQFHDLDPRNPKTDGVCVDYFRKVGDLYLGELFTDHDQVSDAWEAQYMTEKSNTGDIWANRRVYDPDKDFDGDGWSNYAEARAGTSPNTPTERPAPVLEATVYCNTAIGPGPVVFRAWNQRYDSDMTQVPDAIWTVPVNVETAKVGVVYRLAEPDAPGAGGGSNANFTRQSLGYVREGLYKIVAYADRDNNGDYTPGEPFGFVRDVDVGWQGGKFAVELTETSPIFGRINIQTEENDREALYGEYSDTIHIQGPTNPLPRRVHVRVDRYSVNGVRLGTGIGEINLPDRVLVDKYIDCNVRCVFHEGDFLNDGEFDIDWSHFEDMSASEQIAQLPNPDITSVAYRIVVDNALVVSPATNNLSLACVFTRRFDSAEFRQRPVVPAEGLVCHGARPTFSWSMNGRNTYTAFQLQILSGTTVVYDSGVRHAPCMDPEGRYTWTAPISVGDQMPSGRILSAHGNYTWRVAMYNAKFKPSPYVNAFSAAATLRTDVNAVRDVDDNGFNAINACVKYTGPADVIADCDDLTTVAGKVRLQAFTTADFSGKVRFKEVGSTDTKIVSVPASQTIVTNKAEIADASHTMANARLIGLPAGTYYIRAYIDTNGNFQKDEWESWGQATVPVTVGAGLVAPVVGLYIEDADTNQNWVPDAIEYVDGALTNTAYSISLPFGLTIDAIRGAMHRDP